MPLVCYRFPGMDYGIRLCPMLVWRTIMSLKEELWLMLKLVTIVTLSVCVFGVLVFLAIEVAV